MKHEEVNQSELPSQRWRSWSYESVPYILVSHTDTTEIRDMWQVKDWSCACSSIATGILFLSLRLHFWVTDPTPWQLHIPGEICGLMMTGGINKPKQMNLFKALKELAFTWLRSTGRSILPVVGFVFPNDTPVILVYSACHVMVYTSL